MIRKIAIFFSAVLALPMSSFAISGGPFDGGDYGASLDDQGIYQASFRFSNGSGFAQWGNNVGLEATPSSAGAGATSTSSATRGSFLNRTVLYYKGITFLGTATGIADFESNTISGISNAQSDVTLRSTSTTSTGTGQSSTFTSSYALGTEVLSNGGRGFVANIEWTGHITKRSPVMRFTGRGEMTVLGADASAILSSLALSLANQSNSVSITYPVQQPGQTIADYIAAIQAIGNAFSPLNILSNPTFIAAITPKTLSQIQSDSDVVTVRVNGVRRFFVSSR